MADLRRRIIAEFSAKNKAKGEMAGFRRDMDSTGKAMKRMAMGALAAVGGLAVLKRSFDFVIKAGMKQEDAVFLLGAALKSTGDYTDAAMKRFEEFAASIQQATIYGDEEVLALMQLMKSLGVTSSKLEQATRMAIGLAAATGRDVKSMSMYIALAQQGEFTMLRRYIPALRSTTDATEQLRIITEFAANGFKIAEAQAKTTSGALKQMANAWSDVAETISDVALPAMKKQAQMTTKFLTEHRAFLKRYLLDVQEGTEIWWNFWKAVAGYTPGALIYKRLAGKKTLEIGPVRPLTEPEALLEAAKEYHEILIQQAKDEADALKAVRDEQTAAMEKNYEKLIAMGGSHHEMQERMARQRIETEIEVVKQQMEEEEAIREEKLKQIEGRMTDFSMNFRNIMASGLEASMRDFDNWGDHIKNILEEVYWAAIRMAFLEPAAGVLARGLTGALGTILGAGIFATPAPTTPTVFTSPHGGSSIGTAQHGGDVLKTGLAIIHRGETFSGVGGIGGKLDVHIHNEGEGKFEISEVEEYAISDQRIIDVTIRAAGTHGPLRRSIRQASK